MAWRMTVRARRKGGRCETEPAQTAGRTVRKLQSNPARQGQSRGKGRRLYSGGGGMLWQGSEVSLKEPRPSGSGFASEFHSLTLAALSRRTPSVWQGFGHCRPLSRLRAHRLVAVAGRRSI